MSYVLWGLHDSHYFWYVYPLRDFDISVQTKKKIYFEDDILVFTLFLRVGKKDRI